MNSFSINGHDGKIEVFIDKVFGYPNLTSHYGGYDARGSVKMKSKGYSAMGELCFSTGEIYHFYEDLVCANKELKGKSVFTTASGGNLQIIIEFKKLGGVRIIAEYQERYDLDNILKLDFESDQSFLYESLKQLKSIIDYYGDDKGKRR